MRCEGRGGNEDQLDDLLGPTIPAKRLGDEANVCAHADAPGAANPSAAPPRR
jgi:hypothetical protein